MHARAHTHTHTHTHTQKKQEPQIRIDQLIIIPGSLRNLGSGFGLPGYGIVVKIKLISRRREFQ